MIPRWPAGLEMPRLGLAALRQRLLVRSVFVLLTLATLALSVVLLREEKERAWRSYVHGFERSQAEVMARLRHPAGQLAVLNAAYPQTHTGVAPLLLPYAALDFDDQYKAQQAIEMAGCSVSYPNGSSLCTAIGNNPYAGGFIYLVGQFNSGPLQSRERGMLDLADVHHARIRLQMRGTDSEWVAPFEALPPTSADTVRGRLTGFVGNAPQLDKLARPVRDFRGWLWQNGPCVDGGNDLGTCTRRAFFSIRLPVDVFRDALFSQGRRVSVAWPPEDLGDIRVHLQMWAPQQATPLLDNRTPGAQPLASLQDVARGLLPGEQVALHKTGSTDQPTIIQGAGRSSDTPPPPWLVRLISALPLDTPVTAPTATTQLATALGPYTVTFSGDLRGVEQNLGAVATRMTWYVLAMLAAIVLGWLVIEIGLLRRVKALTRRAAAVSYNMHDAQWGARLGKLDVADLRGKDELGILAGGLADLLQRVQDDLHREQLRTQQERDMWHAVGHEIMSPLQSLMVLHSGTDDPARRYVQRMQQAVHVLYGTASPAEAIAAADLPQGRLDLDAFLRTIATNAPFASIHNVVHAPDTRTDGAPVWVRADEFALEDAVTHILRNADRLRPANSPITLTLTASASTASATVHNCGSTIADDLLDKIFELGVSSAMPDDPLSPSEHRGQGLFVAKTYMAKMGGTISARNEADGVAFVLTFQRLG